MSDAVGTHLGHLSEEARDRRRIKNARSQSKRGTDARAPGSQRKSPKRLIVGKATRTR